MVVIVREKQIRCKFLKAAQDVKGKCPDLIHALQIFLFY